MTLDSRLDLIRSALRESARVKEALTAEASTIIRVADRLAATFRAGGHLYACGNGGSACDAMHLVEELVARYKADRPGIPAHHLMDPSTLTCWSNDYEYATAFRRQVETLMRPGDVLVAISTSGNSPNVVMAARAALEKGAWVIGLTGADGGELGRIATEPLRVPSGATERIQEAHITLIHLLCELVEKELYPLDSSSLPGTPVPR
ncbi:MAG: SIS domain-containing protein [Gemmatimonadota bacterium]|nr:SIS domain-containing protein [Gemmatimonadota bacterium]